MRTTVGLARERLTLIRIFEDLRALGYGGSYAAVRRYAIAWREKRASTTADAYIPLSFAPGEAYQFDWSHEIALIGGVTTTLKVAHVRLCHSRMMFVRAYPRETPGDGVRRPRPRLRVLQGRLRARHLRQSMDVSRARRSVGVGGWNARIYPACCGTIRVPGLDGSPLLLAS